MQTTEIAKLESCGGQHAGWVCRCRLCEGCECWRQNPSPRSPEDPGCQHTVETAPRTNWDQSAKPFQPAGAVGVDQQAHLILLLLEKRQNKEVARVPQVPRYATSPANGRSIDLFDTMGIYEATSSAWEYQSEARKQTDGDWAWHSGNPKVRYVRSLGERCHSGGGKRKTMFRSSSTVWAHAVLHSLSKKGRRRAGRN